MPRHNCSCRFAFAQINSASRIGWPVGSRSVSRYRMDAMILG